MNTAVDQQLHSAGWSSLVARRAHNPKVVGSNPAPATNLTSRLDDLEGLSDLLFLYQIAYLLSNSIFM